MAVQEIVQKVKEVYPEAVTEWVELSNGNGYYVVLPSNGVNIKQPTLGEGSSELLAWQSAFQHLPFGVYYNLTSWLSQWEA